MAEKKTTSEFAERGMYGKYVVRKAGSGEYIEDCFVLRPKKDKAAVAALIAYANATQNETLRKDIFKWMERLESGKEWAW